jgi:3-hydroxyisobutyrate dehydrogenase
MTTPNTTSIRKVAVLGTGTMGSPIARNIAKGGFSVRVWNRTRKRAGPLVDAGVTIADIAADAVRDVDVIVTMLTDGDAVLETMEAAAAGLRPGTIWAQMSTVAAKAVPVLVRFANQHQLVFIDAPVQGSRQPAEQGQLVVIAASSSAVRPMIEPVFSALGKRTVWVSEESSSGAATRLKLALNHYAFGLTHAIAESLAMAKTLNVDPRFVIDVVSGGPMDSGYFQLKGASILKADFAPSFTIRNAVKDARLIAEAARDAGLQADVAEASLRRFERALAAGHGDKDMAASFLAG